MSKINIEGSGNTQELLRMLAWIEVLGNIGHSTDFKVFVDGDGSARWKFKFENKNEQEEFDNLRKQLIQETLTSDIDGFSI